MEAMACGLPIVTTHAGDTQELVDDHPLSLEQVGSSAVRAWELLWQTTIGEGEAKIRLIDLDVPATVVGYFFEKLLVKELASRFPGEWRGGMSKGEKDLVYEPDGRYSTEVKTSGQAKTEVYGNRSYGKAPREGDLEHKPEKSGYYITVNFYGHRLTLLRIGWIDFSDWSSQKKESGQAATLSSDVYKCKLLDIDGEYRLNSAVRLVDGVGEVKEAHLATLGIRSVADLLAYDGDDRAALGLREKISGDYG